MKELADKCLGCPALDFDRPWYEAARTAKKARYCPLTQAARESLRPCGHRRRFEHQRAAWAVKIAAAQD